MHIVYEEGFTIVWMLIFIIADLIKVTSITKPTIKTCALRLVSNEGRVKILSVNG